jgi:hypothetical protein
MLKQTLTSVLKIQMVRQLLGAGGGALIALACYNGYRFTSSTVQAYLAPPHESIVVAEVQEEPVVIPQEEIMEEPVTQEVVPVSEPVEAEPASEAAEEIVPKKPVQVAAVTDADMLHKGAPQLPDSGIGLWLATGMAAGMAFVSHKKTHALLFAGISEVD